MNTSSPHYTNIVQEYDRRASFYDEHWRFYVEATTKETVSRLSLPGHCQLLDVGCGTGSLIQNVLQRWPTIKPVGVDVSPGMLRMANRKLGKQVFLACADAHRLPFQKQRFDVVVCCNTFHFLRKPQLALKEMKRVLKPDGKMVITDCCDDYLVCRVCDFYLRLFNPAHFKMHKSRECARLLGQAGFEVMMLERYKISRLWGLMTITAKT